MKRDLDLVRALLFKIEALPLNGRVEAREIALPPWSSDEIIYHCRILMMSGYIVATDTSSNRGPNCYIRHLTPEGHDYLDVVRNDTIWATVKDHLRERGISATFDIVIAVGKAAIMKALG
jgi:hypothetical protein